ncbi:MAG: hypothetical protein AB7I25_01790 [Vicinamibacterales bacterium]
MRVLLVVDSGRTATVLTPLVQALRARAHAVTVMCAAVRPTRADVARLGRLDARVVELPSRYRNATGALVIHLRILATSTYYLHPRYRGIRSRGIRHARSKGMARGVRTFGQHLTLLGPWAPRTMRRLLQAVDHLVAPDAKIVDLLRRHRPDIVLSVPPVAGVWGSEVLKAARWLGMPTAVYPASLDDYTTPREFPGPVDRWLVWHDVQRQEVESIIGARPSDVTVVGAQPLQAQRADRPSGPEPARLLAAAGLEPARPFVLLHVMHGVRPGTITRWLSLFQREFPATQVLVWVDRAWMLRGRKPEFGAWDGVGVHRAAVDASGGAGPLMATVRRAAAVVRLSPHGTLDVLAAGRPLHYLIELHAEHRVEFESCRHHLNPLSARFPSLVSFTTDEDDHVLALAFSLKEGPHPEDLAGFEKEFGLDGLVASRVEAALLATERGFAWRPEGGPSAVIARPITTVLAVMVPRPRSVTSRLVLPKLETGFFANVAKVWRDTSESFALTRDVVEKRRERYVSDDPLWRRAGQWLDRWRRPLTKWTARQWRQTQKSVTKARHRGRKKFAQVRRVAAERLRGSSRPRT